MTKLRTILTTAALTLGLSAAALISGCHFHGVEGEAHHRSTVKPFHSPHRWVYSHDYAAYYCGEHEHYWVYDGDEWEQHDNFDTGRSHALELDLRVNEPYRQHELHHPGFEYQVKP